MSSALQTAMAVTAVVAVGTAYVLIHEHRRKLKKERKKDAGGEGSSSGQGQRGGLMISREQLLAILDESATAAFQLIEQVRSIPSAPEPPLRSAAAAPAPSCLRAGPDVRRLCDRRARWSS